MTTSGMGPLCAQSMGVRTNIIKYQTKNHRKKKSRQSAPGAAHLDAVALLRVEVPCVGAVARGALLRHGLGRARLGGRQLRERALGRAGARGGLADVGRALRFDGLRAQNTEQGYSIDIWAQRIRARNTRDKNNNDIKKGPEKSTRHADNDPQNADSQETRIAGFLMRNRAKSTERGSCRKAVAHQP